MSSRLSILACAVLFLTFGSDVFAQGYSSRSYRSTSSYSSDVHHNYISGAFGFLAPGENMLAGTLADGTQVTTTGFNLSGLFGIGADYDYMFNKGLSVGGVLRYYNVSSTINSQTYQNTLFTLGPDARAYFPMDNWVPYFSAGIMFMAPGLTVANRAITVSSGLGLMLSAGILYQLSDTIGIGIETMRLTGLSNSINGNLIEDYMLKGRFALGN